jgi:transposase
MAYVYISRKRYKDTDYAYVQICETVRKNGVPTRRVLGNLGRLDRLDPRRVDNLIRGLRRFGTEASQQGPSLEEAEIVAHRLLGPILAIRAIWEELGLPELIEQGQQAFSVEQALFRLVANRLLEPCSKRAFTLAWQQEVEWPQRGSYSYDDYLRAMDALHPQIRRLEEGVFARLRTLFSLPLRLVLYDLTSTYFEGQGVCSLAAFGHSRDHRRDRRQIVLGLGLTEEGLPIAHHVFPGSTVDVTTVQGVSREMTERFGLPEAVLVMDRGALSEGNIAAVERAGLRYVMALRTRQHRAAWRAIREAEALGLRRVRDPQAEWQVQEVTPVEGRRHVVVYSAFRALHDRQVRLRRLRGAREALNRLARGVRAGTLRRERQVAERVGRILSRHGVRTLIRWRLEEGVFRWGLDWEAYRRQRRLDGFYVFVSNDPTLSTQQIVDSYRQLQEVEAAFRVLKSVIKLRPIYHWTRRRVESHIAVCMLAFLVAKVLEQRLRAAGQEVSAARALQLLRGVQATDQVWDDLLVTRMSRPTPEAGAILEALGLSDAPKILRMRPLAPPA